MEPRTRETKQKKPKKKNKKINKKTLKRNPEAKCMVCTWLKNHSAKKAIDDASKRKIHQRKQLLNK